MSGGVELNMQFLMSDRTTEYSDHVNIDMWYSSSDHKSMRMVQHLAWMVDKVPEMFDINPKIVSRPCSDDLSICDSTYKSFHCVSNG